MNIKVNEKIEVPFTTTTPSGKFSVTIEKAITENVGACAFTAAPNSTNAAGFSYRISFARPINPLTFTTADIVNLGTGGGTALTFSLTNCGDDTNFRLSVTSVTGDGTIEPSLPADLVQDVSGNLNNASTSSNNTVTIDTAVLSVTIEQAITETVGTCSFTAANDPTHAAGFSYKASFSKVITPATFVTSDISNGGTGGTGLLTWTITSCGDNRHFMVTATQVQGGGTIIPSLSAGVVSDPAGNLNTISTSVDNTVTFFWGWYQEAYIKSVNADAGDNFGNKVAIDGDTLVVGVRYEASNQNTITNGTTASADNSLMNSGAAYVYRRTGSNWAQEAYIKAANARAFRDFGNAISLSKDTIAVASYTESSSQNTITNGATASTDNTSPAAGAVYIYKRTGTNWAQEAYIKAATNVFEGDYFGHQASLYNDTLAVAAPNDDSSQTTITNGTGVSFNNGAPEAGAVFIYRRTGVNWAQEAYIKASNADAGDGFGTSLSLHKDTLAVWSSSEDSNQSTITNGTTSSADNTNSGSGAVYVYRRTGVNWAQEAYIKAANNSLGDAFGWSLSVHEERLAVSATNEDSNQNTITNGATANADDSVASSGAVYVYARTGVNWAQESFIKASNNAANNIFGSAVSLNSNTLAVSAINEDSNQNTITNGTTSSLDTSASNSGAVYVYARTGVNWAQEAYIKAVNNAASQEFGKEVSLSGDTLVVGVPYDDSNQTTITNGSTASSDTSSTNSGAVFVYRNNSRLFEVAKLVLTPGTNDVTLDWVRTGRYATGYFISYQVGATPPATCTAGTSVDLGDVITHTENGLTGSTTYSFRICSTRDGVTFSPGLTATVTTL